MEGTERLAGHSGRKEQGDGRLPGHSFATTDCFQGPSWCQPGTQPRQPASLSLPLLSSPCPTGQATAAQQRAPKPGQITLLLVTKGNLSPPSGQVAGKGARPCPPNSPASHSSSLALGLRRSHGRAWSSRSKSQALWSKLRSC